MSDYIHTSGQRDDVFKEGKPPPVNTRHNTYSAVNNTTARSRVYIDMLNLSSRRVRHGARRKQS